MEEKQYEGKVQITSAEYRELVTESTESRLRYETCRSEKWQLESEVKKLEEELASTRKELDSFRNQLATRSVWHGNDQRTGSAYDSSGPITNPCTWEVKNG